MLFKIISAYFFEVALIFLRRTTTKELWTSILAEIEQEDHNFKRAATDWLYCKLIMVSFCFRTFLAKKEKRTCKKQQALFFKISSNFYKLNYP